MFNEPVKMLYDTGSDITCVNEEIFRKIPIDQRPAKIQENHQKQFRSAGGQSLKVKGKFLLPLTLGKKTVSHPCYVIKNLSEAAIMGIDFIQQHKLNYCPDKRSFSWKGGTSWTSGLMKLCSTETIPALTVVQVRVNLITDSGYTPSSDHDCLIKVSVNNKPIITGGPALVRPNSVGQAYVRISNCAPTDVTLSRSEILGFIENISDCEKRQINPTFINSVADKKLTEKPPVPLPAEKEAFIKENVQLNVPDNFRQRYLDILLKNHEVISAHKYDLGQAKSFMHDISLKSEEPIYVKQFKIPDAHREEVEKHVAEWLKLGVVQPARSKFNSPIFVVAKKNGGLRMVQDFRALNAKPTWTSTP